MKIKEDKLIRCPICESVNIKSKEVDICRRCGSAMYRHKNFTTEKSWAYLITAIIFYIPANLYPMLIIKQFGMEEGSTIIGGIILLWEHGSYPIAIIILFASVFVPILKFLLLLYLLLGIKYSIGEKNRVDKHKLYYITEVIGPWSMIDVFVVVILAGLIHLSSISMLAGTASTAFALSVFFTIMSAQSFDNSQLKGYKE
jgi:paraquat-inducible protein A